MMLESVQLNYSQALVLVLVLVLESGLMNWEALIKGVGVWSDELLGCSSRDAGSWSDELVEGPGKG